MNEPPVLSLGELVSTMVLNGSPKRMILDGWNYETVPEEYREDWATLQSLLLKAELLNQELKEKILYD